MKKRVQFIFLFFYSLHAVAQGNYVFAGSEAVNLSSVDFAACGYISWATEKTASPGYFSFLNGASFAGASDTSNVDGYVKKYGNEAFTFPVGTGSALRTLSVSAPSNATDAFATAWMPGDPSLIDDLTAPATGIHSRVFTGTGILAVSPVGQWDWQDFNNTGNGLTITVSMPDMTRFASTANLRLVGWDGGQWRDLSGSATASGNTDGSTLSGTMINGITAIGIGSVAFAIGIEISAFQVAERSCKAYLSWTTAYEAEGSHFEVEQSANGNSFTKIASLPATFTGTGGSYNYSASQNRGAPYYYRLKTINNEGGFKYSVMRVVTTNCGNTGTYMFIYPNPVERGVTGLSVRIKTDYNGPALLWITDNLGHRVTGQMISITSGENVFSFNSILLSAGTYYVKLLTASGENIGETQKLIKQ